MTKIIRTLAFGLAILLGCAGGNIALAAAQAVTPGMGTPAGAWTPTTPQTPLTTGSDTSEACASPTVTAGAYAAGNEVGALIPLALFSTNLGAAAPLYSGYLTSLRLNFKDVQTAEFDVTLFQTQPSSTTWTDKQTPTLAAADAFSNYPPIRLTFPYSGLGTGTVYGADAIGHAMKISAATLYAVIIAPSGATIGSTSDVQLCATVQKDNG